VLLGNRSGWLTATAVVVAALVALPVVGCAAPPSAGAARTTVAYRARARPAATRRSAARRVRGPSELIVVTARSHVTTYARLVAYHRVGSRWVKSFGPWTARVGYNGIAYPGAKREGDGKTPSGTYGFGFFFGVRPNPGVAFKYRRAHSYDVWDDDPSSPNYNEWVDTRYRNPGANPEPMDDPPAYNYGAVIAYNTKRVPGLGSAIFLHVGTDGPTLGCVSLPQRDLLKVLRWMRPKYSPQIEIRVRA
jgi:L,D-peptidoglycan transpeptidase YkuD (ErfK/YbiS/YcfS/YnhG family)